MAEFDLGQPPVGDGTPFPERDSRGLDRPTLRAHEHRQVAYAGRRDQRPHLGRLSPATPSPPCIRRATLESVSPWRRM